MRFLCPLLALPLCAADISVAPQSLSFAYQFNSPILPPQAIVIASPQSAPFTATRPADQPWIVLPSGTASVSATAPAALPISIDPGKLLPGTYAGAVTLRFGGNAVTVPVSLKVSANAILAASPAILLFDPTAPLQILALGLSSGEPLLLSASTSTAWLTVQGASSPLRVAANPARAGPGVSAGSVEVRSVSVLPAANSPLSVPAVFLPSGLASRGPLTIDPPAVSFSGADIRQVAVTGGAFTPSTDAKWLSLATSGQTLSVSANPAGLPPGSYDATVTLASGGVLQMLPVALTVPAAAPPVLSKIVNAASWAEGPIAPGEVLALGGSNLGPGALTGLTLEGGSVSTTLAGVRVLFNGTPAPLLYAASTQLAAVVPYDLDGKPAASVQVVVNGAASNTLTVPVAPAAPGVFTTDASGRGAGAILNGDNSLNSPSRPATGGGTIAVYMTGEGQTTPAGIDGRITSIPPVPRLPVTASIDGRPAEVLFAGEAPGLVAGVMQVNLRIPDGVRAGEVPLVVTIGGVSSQNGVTVSVR